jgi:hypothetical protein
MGPHADFCLYPGEQVSQLTHPSVPSELRYCPAGQLLHSPLFWHDLPIGHWAQSVHTLLDEVVHGTSSKNMLFALIVLNKHGKRHFSQKQELYVVLNQPGRQDSHELVVYVIN